MNTNYVYSHKSGMNNASGYLARAMGIKKIKRKNSTFIGNDNKTVINWGCSKLPAQVLQCRVINRPEAIARVVDKTLFFADATMAQDAPRIPKWTLDQYVAREWQEEFGHTVLARDTATGCRGQGITVCPPGVDIPQNLWYTIYVNGREEWRVHCIGQGSGAYAFDIQRKRKKNGIEANKYIRNRKNGWVFCRNEEEVPADVVVQASKAHDLTGLDFSAIDIRYMPTTKKAYVLEVNTAPYLMGSTLKNYASVLSNY